MAAPRSIFFIGLGATVGVSPAAPGTTMPQFVPSNPSLHSHVPLLQRPLPEQSLRHRFHWHDSPKCFSLQRQVPIKQCPRPPQLSGQGWMSHTSPLQPPLHLQTPSLQAPWPVQSLKHFWPGAGAGAAESWLSKAMEAPAEARVGAATSASLPDCFKASDRFKAPAAAMARWAACLA